MKVTFRLDHWQPKEWREFEFDYATPLRMTWVSTDLDRDDASLIAGAIVWGLNKAFAIRETADAMFCREEAENITKAAIREYLGYYITYNPLTDDLPF